MFYRFDKPYIPMTLIVILLVSFIFRWTIVATTPDWELVWRKDNWTGDTWLTIYTASKAFEQLIDTKYELLPLKTQPTPSDNEVWQRQMMTKITPDEELQWQQETSRSLTSMTLEFLGLKQNQIMYESTEKIETTREALKNRLTSAWLITLGFAVVWLVSTGITEKSKERENF